MNCARNETSSDFHNDMPCVQRLHSNWICALCFCLHRKRSERATQKNSRHSSANGRALGCTIYIILLKFLANAHSNVMDTLIPKLSRWRGEKLICSMWNCLETVAWFVHKCEQFAWTFFRFKKTTFSREKTVFVRHDQSILESVPKREHWVVQLDIRQ